MSKAPTIVPIKWWHKFSPKHRRMFRVMNYIMQYHWDSGGEEEYKKNIVNAIITGESFMNDE